MSEVFQPVDYLPYDQRQPNTQLEGIGQRILDGNGSWVEDSPQGFKTIKTVGVQLRFQLEHGFPIPTTRDCLAPISRKERNGLSVEMPGMFSQAIAEWAAFANGARTADEFEGFGCYQWRRFLPLERTALVGAPEGDNGPGSYGPAFTNFPAHGDVGFNQLEAVIQQMREHPFLRTHFVSPWIAPYVYRTGRQRTLIAPCHGWMHFMINTERGELTLHHFQRSGDLFVGVQGFNIPQYAAVGMVVANILGLKFHELVYTISDAHVYDYKSHLAKVREVICRAVADPRPFPTVRLNRNFEWLADMRPGHFEVMDYYPHPKLVIPTPI